MQHTPSSPLGSDLKGRLESWKERVAPRLHPVLDRHHDALVGLLDSLERAGHGPEVIRSCLRDLLAAYEADLSAALAGKGTEP